MTSPNKPPADGTKLITPGGMPASRKILNTRYEDKIAEWLGFHSTTLPYKHSLQSSAFNVSTRFSSVTGGAKEPIRLPANQDSSEKQPSKLRWRWWYTLDLKQM